MDSNKRLILTIILTLGIFLGFQYLVPRSEPAPPAEGGPTPAQAEQTVQPTEPAAAPGEPLPTQIPENRATLRTEQMVLAFSNHGAGLVQVELQGPKGRRQGKEDAPQVDLAGGLGEDDPRLFQVQLTGGLPSLQRDCEQLSADEKTVRYRCGAGSDLSLEKTFTLTGPQTLALDLTLTNSGSNPVEGNVDLLVPAAVNPEKQTSPGCGGMLSAPPQPTHAICRHGVDDITRYMFKSGEPSVAPAGRVSFAGFEERYFLAVAVPVKAPAPSSCTLEGVRPELLLTHLVTPTGTLAPGASTQLRFDLVLGKKDHQDLQAMGANIASTTGLPDPALEETVDLGFWAAIARILLGLMKVFHAVIPNWGVAIILLTLFVKALTFPLAWKSMKSMEEMRKLAPEIEALKKKFGDDREKLNLEMMKLYQQHKVNPLGGCLPMLIQMPIWLALYTTLQTSVDLYNEPFIAGWISDLTSKDPYYILPLAMGATMFVTQKMQPMQMEAAQQKMMLYFMPAFFTFIMLNLPAGLTLYIFTNNLLSIAQQLFLRKTMGMPLTGAPTAGASVGAKKK